MIKKCHSALFDMKKFEKNQTFDKELEILKLKKRYMFLINQFRELNLAEKLVSDFTDSYKIIFLKKICYIYSENYEIDLLASRLNVLKQIEPDLLSTLEIESFLNKLKSERNSKFIRYSNMFKDDYFEYLLDFKSLSKKCLVHGNDREFVAREYGVYMLEKEPKFVIERIDCSTKQGMLYDIRELCDRYGFMSLTGSPFDILQTTINAYNSPIFRFLFILVNVKEMEILNKFKEIFAKCKVLVLAHETFDLTTLTDKKYSKFNVDNPTREECLRVSQKIETFLSSSPLDLNARENLLSSISKILKNETISRFELNSLLNMFENKENHSKLVDIFGRYSCDIFSYLKEKCTDTFEYLSCFVYLDSRNLSIFLLEKLYYKLYETKAAKQLLNENSIIDFVSELEFLIHMSLLILIDESVFMIPDSYLAVLDEIKSSKMENEAQLEEFNNVVRVLNELVEDEDLEKKSRIDLFFKHASKIIEMDYFVERMKEIYGYGLLIERHKMIKRKFYSRYNLTFGKSYCFNNK